MSIFPNLKLISKFFLLLLLVVTSFYSCNSGSSENSAKENGSDVRLNCEFKGTLTTASGEPINDILIEIPMYNKHTRTNDSGGFSFNLSMTEKESLSVKLNIRHPEKLTSFNLNLSKYPEISVRYDFILDKNSGDIILDNITPDPGIDHADSFRKCTLADEKCKNDEYCFFPEGECGEGTGICRAKPEVCTELFAPVCGCDNQTYSNDCKASSAGVSVKHTGECNTTPN